MQQSNLSSVCRARNHLPFRLRSSLLASVWFLLFGVSQFLFAQPERRQDETASRDQRSRGDSTAHVLTGIDVLERDQFRQLKGRKVGLITNHTGINRKWVSTVELLNHAQDIELVSLFSPEHGFEGKLDIAKINDSRDSQTGLKIHSLYGKTRKPTAEMLVGIDTLVFDIQDIGTRFYTYISTMGNSMKAASESNIRFVVLDRPNPINGMHVQGPMLDKGSESFVGFHRLPVRHGLTVGELATLFKAELNLKVDLQVVRMAGWKRDRMYDEVGLPWVNPSPNMRCLTQAILYPGVGLLEMTNLSVGRGTDTPFEVVGAPYVEATALAAKLNAAKLPGVRFVPVRFTPTSSKYAKQLCEGVNIIVVDRTSFDPIRTGLQLAGTLHALYSNDWKTDNLNRLLAHRQTYQSILEGKSVEFMRKQYLPELNDFVERRNRYLLYEPKQSKSSNRSEAH